MTDDTRDSQPPAETSAKACGISSLRTIKTFWQKGTCSEAMMISGFTEATTYRWTMSERGREFSLYPWKSGEFLGSGRGEVCLEQAGMHAEAQLEVIRKFIGA